MKPRKSTLKRNAEKYYRWIRRSAYRIWVAQIKVTEEAIGGELHAC